MGDGYVMGVGLVMGGYMRDGREDDGQVGNRCMDGYIQGQMTG